jgi:hypothetical protein
LEGIIQENFLETVIGFMVLIFVLAVYGKLWSKWRKRHGSVRSVSQASLRPVLPKTISHRSSLEFTDVILECNESASVPMLDSRFAKIQVRRDKTFVNRGKTSFAE